MPAATSIVNPRGRGTPRDGATPRRRPGWASIVFGLAIVLTSQSLSPSSAWAAPQIVSGTVSFGTAGNHPDDVAAVVTWERYEDGNWIDGPSAGVRTDTAGRYSVPLDPGIYRIRYDPTSTAYQGLYWGGASTSLKATSLVVGDVPVTGLDLTLPLRGSIGGRVFLGDSAHVAAAGQVRATASVCYDDGCRSGGEPVALTDASGGYAFTGLFNGVYTITFTYLSGTEFQAPAAPLVITVSSTQQVFTGQDVTMPASASMSGVVSLGDTSSPAGLDEVVVTAQQYIAWGAGGYAEYTTRTDSTGRYVFPGLPRGLYHLRFDYVGDSGYADQWWPSNPVRSPNTTDFVFGEEPLVRDITLPLGGSVSGILRNSSGTPLGNVPIQASALDPGGYYGYVGVSQTRTSADGAYAFDSLPPAFTSITFAPESEYMATSRYLSLEAGQVEAGFDATVYRFTMLSGSILCEGCDEYEAGLLGVRLERNVGSRSEPVWTDAGFSGVSVNGTSIFYEFRNLVPGMYRASVTGGTGATPRSNVSPVVTMLDGDVTTLDLVAELVGFDRDFSGDRLPDVIVRNTGGAMVMYSGNGASGWNGVATIGSGWSGMDHVFAAGDFSGDGHADVMARDPSGRLYLYRGDGKGGWLGWAVVGSGWGRMTAILSPGDFSGDGNVDVLARDTAGDLWLYTGDGKGGWGTVAKVGSGWNTFDQIFAVGGFGGYGEANVMGRTSNGDLFVYPASGGGGWASPAKVGTGWGIFDAVFGAGDFDGDGNDDVMGRDTAGRLWLYPGGGTSGWGVPAVVGTGWKGLSFVS